MNTSKAIVKQKKLDYAPPNVGVPPLAASRPKDSPSRLEKIRAPIGAVPSKPEVNLDEARRFVQMLGKGSHTWQTFDDNHKRKSPGLISKDWYGTFEAFQNRLVQKNSGGALIAVCINKCKNGKRSKTNITEIRAIYVDTDGAPLEPILNAGPEPHIKVESSPGKYHVYWLVDDCPLEKFEAIMLTLANKFECDKQPCNLNTVMRVPGFLHQKGEPFLTRILELNPQLPKYKTDELISKFGLHIEEPKTMEAPKQEEISSMDILESLGANETGDRLLYVQLHGGKFLYDASGGIWYKWAGHYWSEDVTHDSLVAIENVVEVYLAEADRQNQLFTDATRTDNKKQAEYHQKKADDLVKRVFALRTRKRSENVRYLAGQGSGGLTITGDKFDSDPELLGSKNGVIDLRQGIFRAGRSGDFIKTVCPTEWKGLNEPAPIWERFISEIIVDEKLEPHKETSEYLQRLLGYSITGLRQEHILPFFWGKGRNGKGTLFETLAHVLGPIARKLPSELLLASGRLRDSSAPRPDLMDLQGRRLCWCNETNEGRKLDLSLAKELAGGDSISARPLHGKLTNFIPTFTLILSTNYKPAIPSADSDPIWDRIALVPFRLKFVDIPKEGHERKKDKVLLDVLKTEAPGILAWLVRGTIEWYRIGLNPPKNVLVETEKYQKDEDTVGQFLEKNTSQENESTVQAGPLYTAYMEWCETWGYIPVNKTLFGKEMSRRYEKNAAGRHRFYKGLKLLIEPNKESIEKAVQ